jgi:carbon-monoxide dehydrogenase small subunit
MANMKIQFTVNQKKVSVDVDPRKRLLDVLREDLDLTGSKEGCGKGECGACTVFLNGVRVNSCLIPAFQLSGSRIWTIEGIQAQPVFSSLEEAFIDHGAVQCGYCIPGVVMSTVAFLHENTPPFLQEQITEGLSGNICRCTGYTKILKVLETIQAEKEIMSGIEEIFQK